MPSKKSCLMRGHAPAESTFWTRNGPHDEDEVLLQVNFMDTESWYRHLAMAHATRHFLALEDFANSLQESHSSTKSRAAPKGCVCALRVWCVYVCACALTVAPVEPMLLCASETPCVANYSNRNVRTNPSTQWSPCLPARRNCGASYHQRNLCPSCVVSKRMMCECTHRASEKEERQKRRKHLRYASDIDILPREEVAGRELEAGGKNSFSTHSKLPHLRFGGHSSLFAQESNHDTET